MFSVLFLFKNHIKRLAEKKKMVAALSTTLKQKEACNSALDVRLNELNVTVNERRHIDNVSGKSSFPLMLLSSSHMLFSFYRFF